MMIKIDPAKAKVRTAFKHPSTLYSIVADLRHGRLFGGSDDSSICVFDLAGTKKQADLSWTKHENYVSALAFIDRPEKPLLVSGSYDRRLIWWDADSRQALRTVEAHRGWIRDLAAVPDGSRLVSAADDMVVKVWETSTGRLIRTLEGHARRTPQD